MRKKHWALGLAVVAAGNTALVGLTGAANPAFAAARANPVEITFYEAMPGALGKELQKLTDEFTQANPGIKVDLIYNGSYSTQQQKLTAAIAAGQPPTIAQVQETWTTQYNKDGLLTPLGPLLNPATVKDLIPIWVKDNSYKGVMVTAPFNKSDYVLYYNLDDFKKAGLTEPPHTWAELEADAKQLSAKAGVPGLGLQANYYTFEMMLEQAGGQVLTNDAQHVSKAVAGKKGQQALGFLSRLVTEKAATVIGGSAYLSDGFNTNQYAMDLDTVAALSFINNPNTHFAVAPLPMGKIRKVPTAGTNIALFKGASADQQAAAVKYINFLLSVPSTVDWAETTGYLPVRNAALHDSGWLKYITKNPNESVGPYELKYGYFSPRVAALNSGMTQVTTQIGNCLSGSASVKDALNNSVQALQQALAGN